ncbi:hypothetical protein ACQYAD_02970 [Neobacillus sp. SM06]|uniref:hypothetical protein n=1 Tax=Neobacillus sp. SM06 TaxID=3422492 RepID=UPI003D277B95
MGAGSKKKGYRGEAELAKLTGGKRVPLSGMVNGFDHDVILPNGWAVEVKRQKSGFKTIYKWIEKDHPDIVAYRADHKPWMVTMKLEKFLELLGKNT